MGEPAAPQPFSAALRDARVRHSLALLSARRALFGLPVTLLVLAVFWHAGYPAPRMLALLVTGLLALLAHSVDAARIARSSPATGLLSSFLLILGTQAAVLLLTGGLTSPFAVLLLTVPVAGTATYGRTRESKLLLLLVASLVLLLALLPESLVGPRLPRAHDVALTALALVLLLLQTRFVLSGITEAMQRTAEDVVRLREENLALAQQRERDLRAVSAKVAHELKNPLAAIQGLVQLEARAAQEAKSRERLSVVQAEAERMAGLVRDYLTFSRPLEDLRKQRVDVGIVARDVLATLSGRADGRGVSLAARGDGEAPADPRRLKEALLNLAQNALEATPAGGSVCIALARRDSVLEVCIEDTGRGIAPEVLAQVGTPFFTTREQGTGLGVALARAVFVQHGGDLRYESAVGKGTRAIATLPV